MPIPILRISPTVIDIHTPSMPKSLDKISTGTTIKRIVLQNDKMAEVFLSFRAVNHPDAKILLNRMAMTENASTLTISEEPLMQLFYQHCLCFSCYLQLSCSAIRLIPGLPSRCCIFTVLLFILSCSDCFKIKSLISLACLM